MKTLLIIGILLTLTDATLANNIGISGTWMFQAGLVFLFGAMAIFFQPIFIPTNYGIRQIFLMGSHNTLRLHTYRLSGLFDITTSST